MSFSVHHSLLVIFTALRYPEQGQVSGETQWESPERNVSAREEQGVTGRFITHGSFTSKKLENVGASK